MCAAFCWNAGVDLFEAPSPASWEMVSEVHRVGAVCGEEISSSNGPGVLDESGITDERSLVRFGLVLNAVAAKLLRCEANGVDACSKITVHGTGTATARCFCASLS